MATQFYGGLTLGFSLAILAESCQNGIELPKTTPIKMATKGAAK